MTSAPDDAGPAPGELLAAAQDCARDVARLRAELQRFFVGQEAVVRDTVVAALAGGHVLIEGAPGLGKTLLVRTLAQALDLSFGRVQFTPDLMPADVLGTTILVDAAGVRQLEFQPGPVFCHVLLADEINRATPRTQSALLEAMQEGAVTTGRTTRALPEPFFVLATQNPIELEGTYPLPEAELDRFLFKLIVPPPAPAVLHAILDRTTGALVESPARVLTRERLLALRGLVRQAPIARPVQDYAVRLVAATHPGPAADPEIRRLVRYGSSPRGAQALVLSAKARALADGRLSPSFSDVRASALPALRHRVLLGFEGESEGATTDELITSLLARLPELPREPGGTG